MPKVSNDTNQPLKVIVAWEIMTPFLLSLYDWGVAENVVHKFMNLPPVPFTVSSDYVEWILQPGETRYVRCEHTNGCIFTPLLNTPYIWKFPEWNWIVGNIDPPEHIHIEWVGHWQIVNNEGGSAHWSFLQKPY
jgi:hypothetical protein